MRVEVINSCDDVPVIDVLLETASVVAGRYQGTRLASSGALLHPSSLGQSLIVSLHSVHNDPPLASSVERSDRRDVAGQTGTQVCLLTQLNQPSM